MSWEYKKAVSRIFSTFKRLNKQIYEEDVEALKLLNECIENQSKQAVHSNLIYSKILVLYLRQNLNFYGDIKTAIKALSVELGMPINYQIELLKSELNNNEFNKYIKSIGISDCLNSESSTKNAEELKTIKDNQAEIIEKLMKSWSYENVEKSFYNSANDILKDINNYS